MGKGHGKYCGDFKGPRPITARSWWVAPTACQSRIIWRDKRCEKVSARVEMEDGHLDVWEVIIRAWGTWIAPHHEGPLHIQDSKHMGPYWSILLPPSVFFFCGMDAYSVFRKTLIPFTLTNAPSPNTHTPVEVGFNMIKCVKWVIEQICAAQGTSWRVCMCFWREGPSVLCCWGKCFRDASSFIHSCSKQNYHRWCIDITFD